MVKVQSSSATRELVSYEEQSRHGRLKECKINLFVTNMTCSFIDFLCQYVVHGNVFIIYSLLLQLPEARQSAWCSMTRWQ